MYSSKRSLTSRDIELYVPKKEIEQRVYAKIQRTHKDTKIVSCSFPMSLFVRSMVWCNIE